MSNLQKIIDFDRMKKEFLIPSEKYYYFINDFTNPTEIICCKKGDFFCNDRSIIIPYSVGHELILKERGIATADEIEEMNAEIKKWMDK